MKIPAALARSLLAITSGPFSRDDVHARDRCDKVRTECKIAVENALYRCVDAATERGHWTLEESDKFCKNWNASDWVWQRQDPELGGGWAWQTPGPWLTRDREHFNAKCVVLNTSHPFSTSSDKPDFPRPPGWHYPDRVPDLSAGGWMVWIVSTATITGFMDLAVCVSRQNC